MLVNHTLSNEALVPANKRPAQLPLLDIEKIDNSIICTGGQPRIPLGEVQIIDWEEMVFEFVG